MTLDSDNSPELLYQFRDLKNRIQVAQYNAMYQVNVEQLSAYFDIGKVISENVGSQKWGSGVIVKLAEYFRIELPGISGLNQRNLYYMKSFYEIFKDFAIVQQAAAKITWRHHQVIIDSTKSLEDVLFYVNLSITKQYSSVRLKEAIKRDELKNFKNSQNNFDVRFSQISQGRHLIIGDETSLDFLLLAQDHKEKEVEDGIVRNIVKFLDRMGGRMAFVGRQYPVKFTEKQYFIDLLFYHLDLNCYIVFELKASEFKPDFIGQLALYLGAVNKEVKKESDKPTIGVLLCKKRDKVEVEYLLNTINAPIGVSTYTYNELPEEVAKFLPDIGDIDFKNTENDES
jgi:predicted nuclease of restriction endonuclease-like (RecB) superfamily